MLKTVFGIFAAAFLLLGAYNYAKADDCRDNLKFTNFVAAMNEDKIPVRPLTEVELKFLLETKGPPPVEAPFEISLVETEDNSMLLIVKDGCIVGKLGPLPTFLMQGILGTTKAGTDQNG